MAWIWHHGFETGLTYTGYKNSLSTTGDYDASGWIVEDDGSGNYPDFSSTTTHSAGGVTGGASSAYSLKMDRTGQRVGPMAFGIDEAQNFRVANPISISFAFRADGVVSTAGSNPLIAIRTEPDGARSGFSIIPVASTGAYGLGISTVVDGGGTAHAKATPTPLTAGTWYWLTAAAYSVFNGTNYDLHYRLYINGVEEVSFQSTAISLFSWAQFDFGWIGTTGVQTFFFDDIVVYDEPDVFADLNSSWTDPAKTRHYIFGSPVARIVSRGLFTNESAASTDAAVLTALTTKNITTYATYTNAADPTQTLKLNSKPISSVIGSDYVPPTIVAVSSAVCMQAETVAAEVFSACTVNGTAHSYLGDITTSTYTEGYGGSATFGSGVLMEVGSNSGALAGASIPLSDLDHANTVLDIKIRALGATDEWRIFSATTEILWNKIRQADKASTRTDISPKAALIFQDPELLSDNKYDTTAGIGYSFTQRGPYQDTSFPATANSGNMMGFASGDWRTTTGEPDARVPQNLKLEVCRTGGLLAESEWTWGYQNWPTNPASQFQAGYSDVRLPWVSYDPFTNATSDLGQGGGEGTVLEVAYSSKHDRVLFYRWRDTGVAGADQYRCEIAYKNNSMYSVYDDGYEEVFSFARMIPVVDGDFATSGTTVNNYVRRILVGSALPWGFSIVETNDQVMHLFVGYFIPDPMRPPSGGFKDIAHYTSTDGGLNWTFKQDGILEKFYGGPTLSDYFQVAVSGDWFHMGITEQGATLRTDGYYAIVSNDQGASWKEVYPPNEDTGISGGVPAIIQKLGIPADNASTTVPQQDRNFSVCGSPANDGTFIIYAYENGGTNPQPLGGRTLAVYTAYRDSKLAKPEPVYVLSAATTLAQTVYVPMAFCAVAGAADVYVFSQGYLEDYDSSGVSAVTTSYGWVGHTSRVIPGDAIADIGLFYFDAAVAHYPPKYRASGKWCAYSNQQNRGDYLGMANAQGYTPTWIRAIWAGDRIITAHRAIDSGGMTSADEIEGFRVQEWGGWSYRPIRAETPWYAELPTQVAAAYWNSTMGCPRGSTDPDTMPNVASVMWQDVIITPSGATPTIEINNAVSALEMTIDTGSDKTGYLRKTFGKNETGSAGLTQSIGSRGLVACAVNLSQTADGIAGTSPSWGGTTGGASININGPVHGVFVHIENSFNGTATTRQSLVTVDIVRDGSNVNFHVFDTVAGTSLAVISKGYLLTHDVRLSLFDDQHYASAAGTTNQFCELSIGMHGARYPSWTTTGLLTLTSKAMSAGEKEYVYFGGLGTTTEVATLTAKSRWSQFLISKMAQGNSLSQVDWSETTNNRGFPCTPYNQFMTQGVSARWGGDSAVKADVHTAQTAFQYGFNNLTYSSRVYEWRSNDLGASGATETLAWRAGESSTDGYMHSFVHQGLSIWGANTRLMTLEYEHPGPATTVALNLTEYATSIVSLGDQGAAGTSNTKLSFTVSHNDARKWGDEELAGKYVDIEALDGTMRAFKISGNRGNAISISGLNTQMQNMASVLDTLHIYSGNTVLFFGQDMEYNHMTLAMTSGGTSATAPNPPEGYFKVSNVVAGLTLPFTVPMAWNHKDTERPNVTLYTAKSGIRTAYKEGRPRRSITGQVLGDVENWRQSLRSTVREVAGYSENAMVLCLDTSSPSDRNSMYCRYMGDTSDNNVGWAYDEVSDRWYQIGDVSVKFEEEL
jgi:hypothetical protein